MLTHQEFLDKLFGGLLETYGIDTINKLYGDVIPVTHRLLRTCPTCEKVEMNFKVTELIPSTLIIPILSPTTFKLCSACKSVFYCSRDCQLKDCQKHKEKCRKK